jgi:hypothetical protein
MQAACDGSPRRAKILAPELRRRQAAHRRSPSRDSDCAFDRHRYELDDTVTPSRPNSIATDARSRDARREYASLLFAAAEQVAAMLASDGTARRGARG